MANKNEQEGARLRREDRHRRLKEWFPRLSETDRRERERRADEIAQRGRAGLRKACVPRRKTGEELQIDDRVKVQKTGKKGLFVRDPAGFQRDGKNIIGGVFNGATGTIIAGPAFGDGRRWWRVRWDPGDQVKCGDLNPCIGWSVDADAPNFNVVLLAKIK